MSKILKHESWNLIKSDEAITIDLSRDLVILTGYNGVGKSTLLAAIHTAVTSLHDGRFGFSREDWAQRLYLEGNVQVVNARLRNLSDVENERGAFKYDPAKHSIELVFKELSGRFQRHQKNKNQYATHSAESKEPKLLDFTVVSNPELDDEAEISLRMNTILYCDEQFNFNEESEEVDKLVKLEVITSSRNLDRTLFFLLGKFAVLFGAHSGGKDLKKLIDELELGGASKTISDEVLERLKKINLTNQSGAHLQLIDEANLFFEQTGRKVVIGDDGFLELDIGSEHRRVKWYDLSKGEKTLLCLLLITHANKDSGRVFLFDEPDLSLHISWQEMLLPALRRLAPSSQFIVTTHSPAMVGNTGDELIVNMAALLKG